MVDFFGERHKPKPGNVFDSPDLCQFDMKEPGSEHLCWKNKDTLAATYPELAILEIQCVKQAGNRVHKQIRI